MATKAEIINKVNTDLASNSNIQAVSHRGVLHGNNESIIDNFYGIVTTDNSNSSGGSSTGIVTPNNSDYNYGLDITKVGTRVNITGSISNSSGVILPPSTLFFTINESQYLMQTSSGDGFVYNLIFKGFSDINNQEITISLGSNNLKIEESMPINSIYKFSITYNTAN